MNIHCHASVMPLYRALGNGDANKGFAETCKMSHQEANKKLYDMGHAHPVSGVNCHSPDTNSKTAGTGEQGASSAAPAIPVTGGAAEPKTPANRPPYRCAS